MHVAKPELAYGFSMGGQTVKNLRRLSYEFELDQSQPQSTQVGEQTKRKSKTCIYLRRRASSFGQGCIEAISVRAWTAL